MPKIQTTTNVKSWARKLLGRPSGGPAPLPWPPVQPAAPLSPADAIKQRTTELRDKVGVLQINILNQLDLEAGLESAEIKLTKLATDSPSEPKLPGFRAMVDKVKVLTFADPQTQTSVDSDRARTVEWLAELNAKLDTLDPKAGAWHAVPASKRSDDKQANERLGKLKVRLAPQRGVTETNEEYQARVDAAQNDYAGQNGMGKPEDRLARLEEVNALLTHDETVVREHSAKLLDRAISVGMGDCEPILIQYATELAKRDANKKPAGDADTLKKMAKILCERIVQKDLFGRYVGDQLAGTGAVEMIQNADADEFYFWSMTDREVDEKIRTRNPTAKELVTRLEKTAAAAMFSDLSFGHEWWMDQFRAIFVAISEEYAVKVIQRAEAAKANGDGPAISLTAYRGPNEDSVLGKTEWPRLKKDILAKQLPFVFEIYAWSGAPSESSRSAAGPVFTDAKFRQPCFAARDLKATLTTVAEVDKAWWNFADKNDLIQQCGGLHMAGKGTGAAFATMPIAFYNKQLVGKDRSGHIWTMKMDGSPDTDSKLDETAWLATQP